MSKIVGSFSRARLSSFLHPNVDISNKNEKAILNTSIYRSGLIRLCGDRFQPKRCTRPNAGGKTDADARAGFDQDRGGRRYNARFFPAPILHSGIWKGRSQTAVFPKNANRPSRQNRAKNQNQFAATLFVCRRDTANISRQQVLTF